MSTYSSPGYSGCRRTFSTVRRMFGLHCQATLRTPASVKMSWTWRQASTYSPALFPLRRSAHGNHVPFISCANRTITGRPCAFTSWAKRLM